ncbi:hypothetical protein [Halorhodospira neutriphila]|uniref:Uncharacterized protein n=1 Tax=Halorhodospira neutriphila TaxID=168379 RepID=A0ABS1E3G6_9GAMM|nr:hypothetical protein [Halorhodospira neutriphila]MBK1726300.1 hypothetical protein [Halorhodospira neutriphila]
MSTPVQTFQRYFRFVLDGRGHREGVDVRYCRLEAGRAGDEGQVAATVQLEGDRRQLTIRDITIAKPSARRSAGAEGAAPADLKSLRRIYSQTFPLLYAAAMAGALARANNRGAAWLCGYLSRDEIKILPRLFPLERCGERAYRCRTREIIRVAAERMPVLYELILIASEQLRDEPAR